MARHREDDRRQFPHQQRFSIDITNALNVVHRDSRPLFMTAERTVRVSHCLQITICFALIVNHFRHLLAADCGAAGVWKPISTKKRYKDGDFVKIRDT